LLSAARSRPSKAGRKSQAEDYDFSSPHLLTSDRWSALNSVVRRIGERMAESLGLLFQERFATEVVETKQYYAAKLKGEASLASTYTVVMDSDGRNGGMIALPASLAWRWVRKLLGAVSLDAGEEGGKLSPLESTLLMDIFRSIAQAVSDTLGRQSGRMVLPASDIRRGFENLPGSDDDVYCLCSFGMATSPSEGSPGGVGEEEGQQEASQGQAQGEETPRVYVVLSYDVVERTLGAARSASAREAREDLTKYLLEIPVRMRVRLGVARAALREIMSMDSGDVLMLARGPANPVEVVLDEDEKEVFRGTLAQYAGRYAVQITSRTFE